MANTIALKRRIGSVKNTKQITKAMELVAASKMRRAQDSASASRDFRNLARAILTRLRELTDVSQHSLFKQRALKTCLHIVITSDRGLAGAYNANVLKQLAVRLQDDQKNNIASQVIVIGKQGSKFVARFKGVNIVAAYQDFPEHPTANDIRPLLNTIIDKFSAEEIDAADILYTDYKSSINQEVRLHRLLPAAFSEIEIPPDLELATFEPSVKEVLNNVTIRLVEAQLNQAFLESFASEHSMRMMAMKSATDNASDIIDDLTLEFNSARQAAITQEIAEITGGAGAIK